MNDPAQSPLPGNKGSPQPQQTISEASGVGKTESMSTDGDAPFLPSHATSQLPHSYVGGPREPSDNNFALDLLPKSLRGGVSALSSRRPSFAAEFASRPRLLDLPNPGLNVSTQLSLDPFRQSFAGPSSPDSLGFEPSHSRRAGSVIETDFWSRSGDSRNIWVTTASSGPVTSTASTSMHHGSEASFSNLSPTVSAGFSPSAYPNNGSPLSGSILMSPILSGLQNNNVSPKGFTSSVSHKTSMGSLNDFALEPSTGPQRNLRSMSFSYSADRRGSPPKQMLNSFNESSIDEVSEMLGNSHMDERRRSYMAQRNPGMMNPQPSQSLWFNDNAPPSPQSNPAANRRHSYVSTMDSQRAHQSPSGFLRQQNPIGSPVLKNNAGGIAEVSPPASLRTSVDEDISANRELDEITCYFDADTFGRKNSTINAKIMPSAAAALILVQSSRIYFVEFKACRVDVFFIPESSGLNVQINDMVIVDADRGRDLGKIVQTNVSFEQAGMLKWQQHLEQQAALQTPSDATGSSSNGAAFSSGTGGNGNSGGPNVITPKQILRYAQPNEIQQISSKQGDEDAALKTCKAKVQEKKLQMEVLDAEYQWDRRKLTFFYSATHRIDFRDLVRDLFRIYKTRIWMCAIHPAEPHHHTAQPHYPPPTSLDLHSVTSANGPPSIPRALTPPEYHGPVRLAGQQNQTPQLQQFAPWKYNGNVAPHMTGNMFGMGPPNAIPGQHSQVPAQYPNGQFWPPPPPPPAMYDFFGPPPAGIPGPIVPGGSHGAGAMY